MIVVDAGPLIAAAIEDDRDHRRCVDMFAALHLNSEKLLVPQTVLAESAYTIQKQGGTAQELLFLQSIADGDLALVEQRCRSRRRDWPPCSSGRGPRAPRRASVRRPGVLMISDHDR